MQARFLLGPAGSGKTFRCLAEIRAALEENPDGPPLVLLAPKQATFQLERQLLGGTEISGYTRLHIFSFDRLARFIFENLNLAPPKLLSDEGRVMVLRALLLRHEPELKLFGRSARRAGFAQELGALLNEFQQHQFTPAKFRAVAGRGGLPDGLRDKLQDLALLAERYLSWLAEHELQDAGRWLDLATEALRKRSSLQPLAFSLAGLWLDGFAEMTPQELDLLAAVIPFCEGVTLAFCFEASDAGEGATSWLLIWNAIGKTFRQCRSRLESLPGCNIEAEILPRDPKNNRFASSPELARLERCWTRPPLGDSTLGPPPSAISATACANPEAEAVYAAREILKFVRAGNRFRDCAVLVRNLENYHQPLARVFRRYEIPFFLDRREPVAHHPLAELTRNALRTVAFDWRHEDWFAALKAGFASVAEADIDRLENAALEFGWRGKKWREPLPDDRLERLRQKILTPFENFATQLAQSKNQPTGGQLADALRDLWDELQAESTLEQWSDSETDALLPVTRHPSLHTTVWEQMNAWLDNLALAFPREPLPLREWLPIIEAGLAGLTIGIIPPVLDEVLIGAIDRARNPDLKFALVLGLNESVFPAAPGAPTVLTNADRDELEQRGAFLGPDLRERLARERYYGYIACMRAHERLAVTFSHYDVEGKALNSSPFIAHLRRIFSGLEIEEFQNQIGPREAEHASELAPLLVQRRAGILPACVGEADELLEPARSQGRQDARPTLLKIPALKSLADQLAALREPQEGERLSPALAERLYGPALRTSVSRLEEFAQCPFKFFVRSGLRAGERKIFELDARERGSFQHEILKIFHKQVAAEGKRWRDFTPTQARERIGQIASGLIGDFREGLMHDTAQTRFEAHAMTEVLQDFIAIVVSWMREQYHFDPAAAELDFGGDNSRAPAWKIDLGNGHHLALRGRIDRVDLCHNSAGGALAVVMDYKSGGRKWDALLVEHGVQLQLPAYLAAARNWPPEIFGVQKIVPAGVFYVNLRGQFESGQTRDEVLDTTDARKLAYRHHGRFDAGALDKLDSQRARDQFNYRLTDAGKIYANSVEALPRPVFEALLDGVETRLREMGRAIFSGEAKVDPYRKGTETPCEFCDYRAACRIDKWTHQWRGLRPPRANPA